MGRSGRSLEGAIALLTLAFALGAPGVAGADNQRSSLPLGGAAASQVDPDASGTRVVWQDRRHGDWDVYLFDYATGVEMRLTSDPADQMAPSIEGARVVWQDFRNGNWDIYLYDIGTGAVTNLTPNAAAQIAPAVGGARVVWQDDRLGNWDIFARDLSGGPGAVPIVTEPSPQIRPDVSGTSIVWEDHRGADVDVYIRDLATGCETAMAEPGDQRAPAVSSDRLLWEDTRTGTSQVWARNLVSGEQAPAAPSGAAQLSPSIGDGRFLWAESDGTETRVVSRAATGSDAPVVVLGGADAKHAPVGAAGRVVWEQGTGPDARLRWSETGAPSATLVRPRGGGVYVQDSEIPAVGIAGQPALVLGTQLTVELRASDQESGVGTVFVALDGVTICALSAAPYRCVLAVTSGTHTIEATVADLVGNRTATRSTFVTP